MSILPSLIAVLALAPAHALEFDLTDESCDPADWVTVCDSGCDWTGAVLAAELFDPVGSERVCARVYDEVVDLWVPSDRDLVLDAVGATVLKGSVTYPALQVDGRAFVYSSGGFPIDVQGVASVSPLMVTPGAELYLDGALLQPGVSQVFSPPTHGGVGLLMTGSWVEIRSADIRGGSATFAGGALFADYGSVLELGGVTFVDNGAVDQGGDVAALGELIATDCTFSLMEGGAVSPLHGGSVFAEGDVTISGSTFHGRPVDKGGALYAFGYGTSVTIDDAVFLGGQAGLRGGAIYLSGGITSTLTELVFDGVSAPMSAVDRGGALFADGLGFGGDLSIERSVVTSASADLGGAFALVDLSSASLDRVVVEGAEASNRGGAIHAQDIDELSVLGSAFCDVSAADRGGVLHAMGSGSTNMTNVLVQRADAPEGAATSSSAVDVDLRQATLLDVGDPFFATGGELIVERSLLKVTVPADQVTLPVSFAPQDVLLEDSLGTIDLSDPYGASVYVEPLALLGGASDLDAMPCGDEFRPHPLLARAVSASIPRELGDDWGFLGGTAQGLDAAGGIVGYGGVFGVTTWLDDDDGDGWPLGVDCDDQDPAVNPAAAENCEGVDRNCNGDPYDVASLVDGASLAFVDEDGDGFGSDDAPQVWVCSGVPAEGTSLVDGDCDDGDATAYPGAYELCDNVDQDCMGDLDGGQLQAGEGVEATWDGDRDGFVGDEAAVQVFCSVPAPDPNDDGQWLALAEVLGEDCDDTDAAIFEGALEVCDRVDNDCDDLTDEGFDTEWLVDVDGDGVPAEGDVVVSCVAPADGIPAVDLDEYDCDDLDATSYPGAPELCDEADNDCDELVDEDVEQLWYLDADKDGYAGATFEEGCLPPDGGAYLPEAEVLASGFDCDDDDGDRSPGAAEVCNDIDDDCDQEVDETVGDDRVGAVPFWPDADRDGFGAQTLPTWVCDGRLPEGVSDNDADCDDRDGSVNPAAAEVVGNDVDENCDDYLGDQWAGGAGGCASVPVPHAPWWALSLSVLALARRRRLGVA